MMALSDKGKRRSFDCGCAYAQDDTILGRQQDGVYVDNVSRKSGAWEEAVAYAADGDEV